MVKPSTIEQKLLLIREQLKTLRATIVSEDKPKFAEVLAKYTGTSKAVIKDIEKHLSKDEPSPRILAIMNKYNDEGFFGSGITTKKRTFMTVEPEVKEDIKTPKTLSQFLSRETLIDFQNNYDGEKYKNEDWMKSVQRELTKDQSTAKAEEKEVAAPAPAPEEDEEKPEQKLEEDEEKPVSPKVKTYADAVKSEVPVKLKEEVKEEEMETMIPEASAPATAPSQEEPAPPPEETPEQKQTRMKEEQRVENLARMKEQQVLNTPAPSPAMLVNGEAKPMFQPETPIYEEQGGSVGAMQMTQQQVLNALDVNSEENRVSKEERHRQESNIQTLKKEIDCMHQIFDDIVDEFQTAEHRKEYADAIRSENIDSVRVHHRKMKQSISNYYNTTDLKVGVIVSAGSLFSQYNNDLRAVLGASSQGMAQIQGGANLKKIEAGKEEIQTPAEIRPKNAIGGYAHAMRRGVSSRVPPTRETQAKTYKFKKEDMVKQYSTKRQYVIPPRMYNVPENIFLRSKNKQ